jgi:hypothetical protein
MPSTFALLTSDANLLRCQIELVRSRLRPMAEVRPRVVGLGYVEADNVLLRKKPAGVGALELGALISDVVSEVLVFHAGTEGRGPFVDEDAMPLRYRRWLFVHHGELGSPAATRAALHSALPQFMQLQVKGPSPGEICFLAFARALREQARGDEFDLDPSLVGWLLGEVARRVEHAEREAGRVGSLGFFVTDGRVLAATRLNSGSLFYALLEGINHCERCGIAEGTSDLNPLLRAHRRVRGVVLATDVVDPNGFIEVPEASVITVGQDLQVRVSPLPLAVG